LIVSPRAIALDAGRDRVLVIDGNSAAIDAADLATGDRSILSDATHGGGPPFTGPLLDVTVDDARAFAYATDAEFVASAYVGRVVAVDLVSGDRSIVSSASRGTGPTFQFASATAVDAARSRLLVCDTDADRVLAVDLVTGNRTVLSSGTVGAGPTFANPTRIAADPGADRLLVVDGLAGSGAVDLIAVDLATGDRTVVVDALQGNGPRFLNVAQLASGLADGGWLLQDAQIGALLEIDLATGDRVLRSQ
jgi:hypothetical protein